MTERINRREDIITAAGELFIEQGYAATSIQQIADAVGCTKAALYYHFKDKEALLQEVINCYMPDFMSIIPDCVQAVSLRDLIVRFAKGLAKDSHVRVRRIRWLINEFHNMKPSERAILHTKHLAFHKNLADLIYRFVPVRDEADKLAWLTICSALGYGQLFINLDLQSVVNFPVNAYIEKMADVIAAGR